MAATTASVVYSSQITHIGSGTSLASAAINPSSDVSTALASTNLGRYPLADIQLTFTHTATMSPNSVIIVLYRRDLNFDGTNDEPIPTASAATLYKAKYMGAFIAQPFSATSASYTQSMQLTDVPIADQCEFYLENQTNCAILAGWSLKVLPKTVAFA